MNLKVVFNMTRKLTLAPRRRRSSGRHRPASRYGRTSFDSRRATPKLRASLEVALEGWVERTEDHWVRGMTALGMVGFVVSGAFGAAGKLDARAYVLVAMLSAVTVTIGIACASRERVAGEGGPRETPRSSRSR